MAAISLEALVRTAGQALEAEDRYLLGCSAARGGNGGLLLNPNERCYQFVVWRSLLSRWNAVTEKEGGSDLTVYHGDGTKTTIEMKTWFSATGERELPRISADIVKLREASCAQAIMMLFSANPPQQTDKNLAFLHEKVPALSGQPENIYIIPTVDKNGGSVSFWVAAWHVSPS